MRLRKKKTMVPLTEVDNLLESALGDLETATTKLRAYLTVTRPTLKTKRYKEDEGGGGPSDERPDE